MALTTIVYNSYSFDISYEILNPNAKVDLIILHGWGSNKNLMKQSFSSFLHDFRHIYIDLPGFGNSTCDAVLLTSDYVQILDLFIKKINISKEIIIGHSFGGKVALLLSPKKLVLLSSAGIYLKKNLKVRVKIKVFKILKKIGLTKFRNFFVAQDAKELNANMYETFKNVIDEDFSIYFKRYKSKTLICWGKDDKATPLICGETINRMIKYSKLIVYEGDHYFFMKHTKEIALQIQKLRKLD